MQRGQAAKACSLRRSAGSGKLQIRTTIKHAAGRKGPECTTCEAPLFMHFLRSRKAKNLHINSPRDRFSGAELLYLYIIYLYIYKEPACGLCSYLYECCVIPSFWSLCLCRIPQEYEKRTMNTKEKSKKSFKVDTNAIGFS